MAWPAKLSHVTCIGFSDKILPAIKRAIDTRIVVWDESTTRVFMDLATARFEFAECVWEMEEITETITSFRLISGNPTDEALTCAVLRG